MPSFRCNSVFTEKRAQVVIYMTAFLCLLYFASDFTTQFVNNNTATEAILGKPIDADLPSLTFCYHTLDDINIKQKLPKYCFKYDERLVWCNYIKGTKKFQKPCLKSVRVKIECSLRFQEIGCKRCLSYVY